MTNGTGCISLSTFEGIYCIQRSGLYGTIIEINRGFNYIKRQTFLAVMHLGVVKFGFKQ